MSISEFNNSSHKLDFHKIRVKINDGKGTLIRKGVQTNGNLFSSLSYFGTCIFYKVEDVLLWHKNLFYVNFENIVEVSKMEKSKRITKFGKTWGKSTNMCHLLYIKRISECNCLTLMT